MGAALEPRPFELEAGGQALSGEVLGEGPSMVLAHGVTATRRYVVHGSKALARAGYCQISYDARAHGDSAPAPEGGGYGYTDLAADLGAVIGAHADGRPVICGDSMGCHTAAAYALEHADELAGVVLIRPVTLGLPTPPDSLAYWDGLADGLEDGGVEGFMSVYESSLDAAPEFAETILRFTRERMELHRHTDALAEAIRQLPRSLPFDGLAELETLNLPALVVASRDAADPGHPHAVGEAWADALPQGELTGEDEGESPLAWQGGRLARVIAGFCESPAVAERRGS